MKVLTFVLRLRGRLGRADAKQFWHKLF